MSKRRAMFRGAIPFAAVLALVASIVNAQQRQLPERPPVGGIGSAPDAMIFYVAKGPPGACGEGCSEWIAAEGAVQWDTHKRLISILDRQEGRKLPVVINTWGGSSYNVSTSLGRILRDRGLHATVGPTYAKACRGIPAPNVSAERREGLTSQYGDQFRIYLRDMGVDPELLDIVDRNSEQGHETELHADDWQRLKIVTAPSP